MDKNLSILVADNDEEYAKRLVNYIKNCTEFEDADYALNGDDALKMAQLLHPDVIILDVLMPKLDGIGFLRHCGELGLEKKPFIIVNSVSHTPLMVDTAVSYGADYFMLKPQTPKEICETIADFMFRDKGETRNYENNCGQSLEQQVTVYMRRLGIPAHINGFKYLRSAIMYTANDMNMINPITQKLYPLLSNEYEISVQGIDRGIHHAVTLSWKRGDKDLIKEIFGYSPDTPGTRTPTNSEYIAMAADDFRLRMKYQNGN